MAFVLYNPNPTGRNVGDCAIRAVAKALKTDWETAYVMIAENGYAMGDVPSADSVWGSVLRQNGFYRKSIPNSCPVPTTPVYGRTPIFTCQNNGCGCGCGVA